MIKFKFEVSPLYDNISSFELGDIEIISDNVKISSKQGNTNQSMMIFIALADLLDGIFDLVSNKKRKNFSFVGADSSFVIDFEKNGDQIKIANNNLMMEVEIKDFVNALYDSVNTFLQMNEPKIKDEKSAVRDLQNSIEIFRSLKF